jgi:Family of unknown function (DUF5683)
LKTFIYILVFASLFFCKATSQQLVKDSSVFKPKKIDTTSHKHNPRIATKRSALIPGWGQIYNKEWWKVPLVYGALAIPTVTFFYNNDIYKEAKFAYEARFQAALPIGEGRDSVNYKKLETKYQKADINAIQSLRNAARRDRDYSVFWFLIVWGLNVVDATVFGHLKDFDVSQDLSINIKPHFNVATNSPSLSMAFHFKEKVSKLKKWDN